MPYYDDPLAVLRPGFMGFGQPASPTAPIDPFSGAVAGGTPPVPPPQLPPPAAPPPPPVAPAEVNPDLRPTPVQDRGSAWDRLKQLGGSVSDALSASPLPSRSFGDDFPPTPDAPAPQAPPATPPTPAPAPPQAAPSGVPPVGIAALQGVPQAPPPVPPPAPEGPQADQSVAPGQGMSNNARNNPLNLRFAGQDGAVNAGGFAAFPTQEAGIQAASHQFNLYAQRGVGTLSDLITKWAPPSENNTAAYIKTVSQLTGIAPDAKINLADPAVQQKIMPAMARMENGAGGAPGPQGSEPSLATGAADPNNSHIVANSGVVNPTQQQGNQQQGSHPDIAALLGNLKSTPSQQLMALASGLLKGPTFGRGLGEGLTNVNQLTQADKELGVKGAQALALADYRQNQLGLGAGRLNVAAGKGGNVSLPGGGLGRIITDPNTGAQSVVPINGSTGAVDPKISGTAPAQQNADNKGRITDATLDGSLATNRAAAGANVKDMQTFSQQEDAARENIRTIADLKAVLAKEGPAGLAGPDMQSKLKRYFANSFGVEVGGVTPSGISLAEKDMAALRNGQLLSQTKGTVPRSNAELQALQAGMGSLDRNPAALNAILDRDLASNNRFVAAGKAWRSMSSEQKRAAMGENDGLFSSWRDRFNDAAPDAAGITGQPGSIPAPRVQPGPGGTGWQARDPNNGLGFTIH